MLTAIRCRAATETRIEVPDFADARLTSWTLYAHVRLRTALATDTAVTIISKGGVGDSGNYWLELANVSGTTYIRHGFVDDGGTDRVVSTALILVLDRWYTFAGAYSGAGHTVFVWYVLHQKGGSAGDVTLTENETEIVDVTADITGGHDICVGATKAADGTISKAGDIDVCDAAIFNAALLRVTLNRYLLAVLDGTNSILTLRCNEKGGEDVWDRTCNIAVVGGNDGTIINPTPTDRVDGPEDVYFPTSHDGGFVGWVNHVAGLDVTITASDEITGYEAEHLRDGRPASKTRTSNATGGRKVVKIQGHATDAWGAPSLDETITQHPDGMRHMLERVSEYRFWRLVIGTKTWVFDLGIPRPVWLVTMDGHNLFTAVADTYIELGSVGLWYGTSLPVSDFVVPVDLQDLSTLATLPHGHTIPRSGSTPDALAVSWSNLTKRLGYELERAVSAATDGRHVFVCGDLKRSLYGLSVYGRMVGAPSFAPDVTGEYRAAAGLVVLEDVA